MAIVLEQFGGLRPKIDKRLLAIQNAQVAENCLLKSGNLIPYKTATIEKSVVPNTLTSNGYLRITSNDYPTVFDEDGPFEIVPAGP